MRLLALVAFALLVTACGREPQPAWMYQAHLTLPVDGRLCCGP